MDLSIIIPHYDNINGLNTLLVQLFNQLNVLDSIQYEILVIENGTQVQNVIQIESTNLNVIVLSDPKSPYICRNEGAKLSKGTWLLFLDTNITLSKDYLPYLFSKFELNQNILYSAQISHKETTLTRSQWVEMIGFYQYNSLLRQGKMTLAVNLLVHKEVFQQVGFFGESRNGEEIKWVEKAKLLGYKIKPLEGLSVYYHPKKKEKYLQKKVRDGIMDRKDLIEKGYSTMHKYWILLLQMRPPNPFWMYRLLKGENLHNRSPIWYLNVYFAMWYYRIYQKMIALKWIQGTSD